ncbi:MAG TPA: hypothetical protein VJW76_03510, partial [Verrucomicrobiae bacterium]|nr:hypothetical protein [Verrucomicrobiae bacterium]
MSRDDYPVNAVPNCGVRQACISELTVVRLRVAAGVPRAPAPAGPWRLARRTHVGTRSAPKNFAAGYGRSRSRGTAL